MRILSLPAAKAKVARRASIAVQGKIMGYPKSLPANDTGILMEAERQNLLAARLEDYAERQAALRRYL